MSSETPPTPEEIAAALYAAYGFATGGLNFRGDPIPTWEALPAPQKKGWFAAAKEAQRLLG